MCRNRSGERVGRKAGAGWPRPAAWSEGYAMKAGRHSLAHRAQSLQIPDVWVSLGVGGEEIDLSLARSLAVSSPLFFRTRFFPDCHGGRGWLFVRPVQCTLSQCFMTFTNSWLKQFQAFCKKKRFQLLSCHHQTPKSLGILYTLIILSHGTLYTLHDQTFCF